MRYVEQKKIKFKQVRCYQNCRRARSIPKEKKEKTIQKCFCPLRTNVSNVILLLFLQLFLGPLQASYRK